MILSVQTLVPDKDKGELSGLLSDFDGDISNDLVSSDGTPICTPSETNSDCDEKSQEIYDVLGTSCKYAL